VALREIALGLQANQNPVTDRADTRNTDGKANWNFSL
jgi:hypothetical protein